MHRFEGEIDKILTADGITQPDEMTEKINATQSETDGNSVLQRYEGCNDAIIVNILPTFDESWAPPLIIF